MPKNNVEIAYDIYIGAPAAKVWRGIVDGDMTKQYVYGTRLESKPKKGAPYAYVGDGDFRVVDGEILEIEPEKRLVMTWKAHWDDAVAKDRPSRVSTSSRPPDRRLPSFTSSTTISMARLQPTPDRSMGGHSCFHRSGAFSKTENRSRRSNDLPVCGHTKHLSSLSRGQSRAARLSRVSSGARPWKFEGSDRGVGF